MSFEYHLAGNAIFPMNYLIVSQQKYFKIVFELILEKKVFLNFHIPDRTDNKTNLLVVPHL